ncbi:S8 family serine peptidase [Lentzea alba]|uniref:S8 family serine peptidase n=1 Tax=Lentzea alba TaxID=2714351 RepID=UPI0039BF1E24
MRRHLAAACLGLTLAANGGVAAAQDNDLPRIPQALRAGQACTPPSGKKVPDAPWQLSYLGADRLWPLSTGKGVTVAVVDTGVDRSATPADVAGDAGSDCVGHGTVIASLIAAPVKEGSKFAGLAPASRVVVARGTDKFGAATGAGIASGIDAAVAAGARIICVGAVTAEEAPVLRQSVDRALAAGALVVAAAGPDAGSRRSGAPAKYYPAAFPGVLSVAAIGPDGKPEAGAVAGTLVAPGNLVMGAGPGGGQVVAAGPAFAAAHVAAAAALVRAYRPELSTAEVSRLLTETAYRQPGSAVVDPLAALTTGLNRGGDSSVGRESVVVREIPDFGAVRGSALTVAGGVVLGVCLLAAVAVVVPRGRRRGWRAGPVDS